MTEPILHRVAAGDPAAVQECMDRFSGLVWTLCRRLCPTREEAEDAAQEVFVEIWNKAGRYDANLASEVTFVAMIARRRLIDRSRRRQRALQTEVIEDDAQLQAEDRSQELVEIGDEAARAMEAVRQLRPDEQRVLHLAIWEGLSHEQIAKATALPLGTVKTHMRRGLIRVREMLGAGEPSAQEAQP